MNVMLVGNFLLAKVCGLVPLTRMLHRGRRLYPVDPSAGRDLRL